MELKITKAEWDLRPKTKFLRVEGEVIVNSYEDTVSIRIKDLQGVNPNILILEVIVESNGGPMKPQPSPFHFSHMTTGIEEWKEVQVISGSGSDTMLITKLSWV